MGKVRTTDIGGKANILVALCGGSQVIVIASRQLSERVGRLGTERKHLKRARINIWASFQDWRCLEHNMRIGATKAKGAYACNSPAPRWGDRKGGLFRWQANRPVIPSNSRIGLLQVQMSG